MLTQFPGGYLGDKYGHRTIITISLIWAGIATMVSGIITGLVAFIAVRVLTGLGEGAFYSNDRSLIAEETPREKRSLGMGVVITGLALGITIADRLRAEHDRPRRQRLRRRRTPGGCRSCCSAPRRWSSASRSPRYFRRQEPGLPYARATLHLMAFAAVGARRGHGRLLRRRRRRPVGPVDRRARGRPRAAAWSRSCSRAAGRASASCSSNRDLVLINLAFIAVLWNLWFFSFWSVSIVADAAGSSFGRSRRMIAAFNAGAGILGFPIGGWLSDVAVRRGHRPQAARRRLHQRAVRAHADLRLRRRRAARANVWLMAALLFSASTFFNAMQPIAQAMLADIADPAAPRRGVRHEQPDRRDRRRALARPSAARCATRPAAGRPRSSSTPALIAARSCSSSSSARLRGQRGGRGARRTIPAGPPPLLRRRRRQRERQRLAVGAGAQRVVRADRLLERHRHRLVGRRRGSTS